MSLRRRLHRKDPIPACFIYSVNHCEGTPRPPSRQGTERATPEVAADSKPRTHATLQLRACSRSRAHVEDSADARVVQATHPVARRRSIRCTAPTPMQNPVPFGGVETGAEATAFCNSFWVCIHDSQVGRKRCWLPCNAEFHQKHHQDHGGLARVLP